MSPPPQVPTIEYQQFMPYGRQTTDSPERLLYAKALCGFVRETLLEYLGQPGMPAHCKKVGGWGGGGGLHTAGRCVYVRGLHTDGRCVWWWGWGLHTAGRCVGGAGRSLQACK